MDFLFDTLGFTFGSGYWHEKTIREPNVEWVRSGASGKGEARGVASVGKTHAVIRQRLVRPDPIEYSFTETKQPGSVKKARADIFNNHFTKQKVCCLNRRYTYMKWGDSFVRTQRVVCFDIDGRSNKDTKAVVEELVSRFPEVKFIEHNSKSQGYHVYIHFDRPVRDESLKRLEEEFKTKGFTLEAAKSKGHIRLPMGRQYSLFGFYSAKNRSLIRKATSDELFKYWHQYDRFAYFDPALEMEEERKYKREFRGSYKKKKDAQKKLIQILIDNPDFDFGIGERHTQVVRILSYCIRYGLSKDDFVKIGESHDKGAKEKSDYTQLYEWGLKKWNGKGQEIKYKDDYEIILDRVQRYCSTTELPLELNRLIDIRVAESLMPFLYKRRNVCRRGNFKNETMIQARYKERIKAFVLFLIQYQEAKEKEWSLLSSPDLVLPMAFINDRAGIPLPLSFIKFLGKKHKCGNYPEVKAYLEHVELLKPIALKPGVTYAPGTCIYYETDRIMELQRSQG